MLFIDVSCSACSEDSTIARVAGALKSYRPDVAAIAGLESVGAIDLAFAEFEHSEFYYGSPQRDANERARPFPGLVELAANEFVHEQGRFFWISPTPDEPYSTFEGEPPSVLAHGRILDTVSERRLSLVSARTADLDPANASLALSSLLVIVRGLAVISSGVTKSSPEYQENFAVRFVNAADIAEETSVLVASGDPDLYVSQVTDHILLEESGKWRVRKWTADARDPGAGSHPTIVAELQDAYP